MRAFYIYFLLIFFACSSNQSEQTAALSPPNKSIETPSVISILLFQKEQTAEIWMDQPKKTLLKQVEINEEVLKLNPGIFQGFQQISLSLKKSLESHIEHTDSVKRTIIFPNDARKSKQFQPCFACTHSIASIYASLEMYLEDYKVK